MIEVPRASFKTPRIERISVRDWESGVVSALDDRRTPIKGLRHSENLILDQDGIVRQRPGLVSYGPKPEGAIKGELYEFRVVTPTGPINWLICAQLTDDGLEVYAAKGEDDHWTKLPGKLYNASSKNHFLQVASKVLVMNGYDDLSYLDPATMTITTFSPLPNPAAAPTLDTNTGLTGSSFKVFYAMTANSSVGETAGSGVLTLSVKDDRDMWNPDTQSIKFKWTAVSGAKSYNVYAGVGVDGDSDPKLYRLAEGLEPTTLNFTDNGSRALDIYAPLPTENSTAGPKALRGTVINGQAWLTGNPENPYAAYRGGNYKHELDFSPANGGGVTVIGSGTKEIPSIIVPYRDGPGTPKIVALAQGTSGSGKRYMIAPQTLTYGNTTLTAWSVQEDTGADGTDSPDGVIIYNNDLHYPSRDGFKTTGSIPQLQGVLSTRRTSNTIQDAVSSINVQAMDGIVGKAWEGRLYYSLPVGSNKNNQIWVMDTDRGGAWMKPWSISADWMTVYNDNSGGTHFLVVKDDTISEFSESAKSVDNGRPFSSSGMSGQMLFTKDGREWARLLRVVFVLMRPQGEITFTVTGKGEDGKMTFSETKNFIRRTTQTGWGQAAWGQMGWGDFKVAPVIDNPAVEEVEIEVDEDMQWAQYSWMAKKPGVSYGISDVIFEYVNIGIKDLS